ncbi:hypothetical protein [Flavisolibacter nicotianae]|uniref:hypothetical protein n=1 Tax=Flavisolibacter nicotianae TaxID=2364882 RepID=UPI000EADAE18|nr:hypothetical protein [Flavisolibacter nicotianae]
MKKQKPGEAGLLPFYCKKVGLAVMLLAFVPAAIVKILHVAIEPANKEFFRLLTMNAFILGLLLVALAKDRVEDETTMVIRRKAMAWAFVTAVLLVIIKPLVDLLMNERVADMKSQELVVSMLFAYLLMYYLQKKGRRVAANGQSD